jgi:hypothetical protein
MGTLYVDRQGMTLRMRDGVIELRAEGERPRSMPGSLIDRVVLRAGRVSDATPPDWRELDAWVTPARA